MADTLNRDDYRALFENSADAILIIEGDRFVDCNRATVNMLRCSSKAELYSKHPSELSPPFQPDGRSSFDKANEMMQLAKTKGSHRFEWYHVRMDGEVFPVEVLLTAIPNGGSYDLHTVWRDITERKRLERELRHSQKMEAIGRLAGGVAHDFNNQLVPILGYSELLEAALEDEPGLKKPVNAIREAGERAAKMVQRLMTLSHKRSHQPQTIDFQETVEGLIETVRQFIGEDITLTFNHGGQPLAVNIDAGDVEQIVLNLVTNARDALPTGGEMTLRLEQHDVDGQAMALLELCDDGIGMDEHTRSRVFEPFFTTKGIGGGTGLGLSSLYSLVSKAEGRVTVESTLGEGSCFQVLLPIAQRPMPDQPASSNQSAKLGSNVTSPEFAAEILVVEDEDTVAQFMFDVLAPLGHHVALASSGEKALDLIKAQRYDLIISDVIMPGISGPKMIKQIREQGIETPVVFVSGYTDDRLKTHGFDPETVSLIRKPFAPKALRQEVTKVLSMQMHG